jgi:polar amino acid transport system substrate-binding protein
MNYIHDGETTGFAVEVVRALQERMNDETPIQVVSWDQGYERLLKQPDVALFSTFRTRERDPLFQWVGPLVTARLGFYGRKGTGLRVRSLEDARRLKGIGTYHNDAKEQFLEDQGFTNLVSASDPTTNLRHLMSGWIDCVIDTDLSCAYTSLQAGIDPADLELLFQIKELSMYIAFSKDTDPELVAAWQGALQSIKDDGTFSAIQDKWVLSPGTRLIGSGSLESDRPELAPGASTRPALTILTEENPPVNFTRNDKLTGYAVEVVRSIQKRIGGQDGIEITNWKSGYEAALAGPAPCCSRPVARSNGRVCSNGPARFT